MRRTDHSPDRKRTGGQRPHTISISISVQDRGQTTQDFAIGIGVFLLSVAFVFSYLPSLTTPFDSSVGGAETAQADRIADRIVADLSDSETQPNTIDGSELKDGGEYAKETHELRTRLGIRANEDVAFDRVSIRIETLGGEIVTSDGDRLEGGDEYSDQSAASSARIVSLDDGITLDSEYGDKPAYRLVVRVW